MWQQQAFVIDAKFNAHRTQNHPNFRTLYIRRRNQLLRDYSKPDENNLRNQYLKLRTQLLQQRYNVDSISTSRSISARSSSRVSYISDTPENNYVLTWDSLYFASPPSESSSNVIPTHQAEASRAIVGGNTIAENYAFVGVHHIFDQHRAAVTMIAFAHNDRSKLACASYDGTVSICNVTACPPVVENIFKEHKSAVTGFDWSEANDLLVSCSLDATLVLYDMASKTSLRTIPETSNHSILSCLFHPMNNNLVVIGNNSGLVSVVNVSTGIYVRGSATKVEGRVLSLTFDASGRLLWAGNDKGIITSLICDRTGRINKGKRIVVAENCPITCLSWRAWISREARDPTVLVNCAANVVCLFRVSSQDGMLKLKKKFSNRHKSPSCLVKSTFCPIMSFRQGACIVTGSEDSCVYFLDIERESKPIVNKLQGHACPVLGVSFNYDESLLATSDQQGLVIIWSREKPSTKVLDSLRRD